jgi:hypothetical protein
MCGSEGRLTKRLLNATLRRHHLRSTMARPGTSLHALLAGIAMLTAAQNSCAHSIYPESPGALISAFLGLVFALALLVALFVRRRSRGYAVVVIIVTLALFGSFPFLPIGFTVLIFSSLSYGPWILAVFLAFVLWRTAGGQSQPDRRSRGVSR